MQLLRNIYLLILISLRNGSFSQDVDSLDQQELEYLSLRLNPMECLQLVNTITVSMKYATKKRIARILGRNFDSDLVTRQDCLMKLENWNNNFLGKKDSNIRETMDVTLRTLGRPDLASYLARDRKNKSLNRRRPDLASYLARDRKNKSLNRIAKINTNADTSKGQRHPILKRNPYKNSGEVFLNGEKANNKNKNNSTGPTREIHRSAYPTEEKVLLQKKQPNEAKNDQEVTNARTMDWLTILILLSLLFIVTCALILCITRKRRRNKMLSARSNSSYNCTCTCSDMQDIESESIKNYLRYHRDRKNDEESRMLLRNKRKERRKDRNLLESCIKKHSKVKKQRKKHKSKRKPLRTKEFDRMKLYKKKIRSSMSKNYPVCDCCKCIAEYK